MKILRITSCFLAIVFTFFICGCSNKEQEEQIAVPILEDAKIEYKTCQAEITDITQKYYVDAHTDYPYGQSVVAKADGRIKSIEVETPCSVKKGDLICTLYSDEAQEKLEEEEIILNQAKQTLDTLQKNGGSSDEITMAQYDLQLEQLKYDHMVDSLDDYNIYAPCDGTLTIYGRGENEFAEQLNVNMQVYKGQTIGYTTDRSQECICATVNTEAPLNNVNFGTAVTLHQGALVASGKVIDILQTGNGEYSTYLYVIQAEEDNDFIKGESSMNVEFDVYSRLDTVVVPSGAVKTLSGRTYVNILIDGAKVEQDVETGIEDGDNIEIISGLSGGEEIILN